MAQVPQVNRGFWLFQEDGGVHQGVDEHTALKGFELTSPAADLSRGFPFQKAFQHDGYLKLRPSFTLLNGYSTRKRAVYENKIGYILRGGENRKFSFFLAPQTGLVRYPEFISGEVGANFDVNGSTLLSWQPGITGNQAASIGLQAPFAVQYQPSEYFTLTAGNGKQFIGEGYRSMLLSGFSPNHPYASVSTKVWRLKYVNLFSGYSQGMGEQLFYRPNKFSTTHYLSWNVSKSFNIGLFETVVWRSEDSLVRRGFDVHYLNPLIFYRPVEYSTGSSDNVLMGVNMHYTPFDGFRLYGQLLLDELLLKYIRADVSTKLFPSRQTAEPSGWWANKHAGQLGLKWFGPLGMDKLGVQAEFNYARPYTYAHVSALENYGHRDAPLAHPYGANFTEWLAMLNYKHKNWLFEVMYQHSMRGRSRYTNTLLSARFENWGDDIFLPYNTREQEFGNHIGQGSRVTMDRVALKASYLILPEVNMRFFATVQHRQEKIDPASVRSIPASVNLDTEEMMFLFGVSTRLYNSYYDL